MLLEDFFPNLLCSNVKFLIAVAVCGSFYFGWISLHLLTKSSLGKLALCCVKHLIAV